MKRLVSLTLLLTLAISLAVPPGTVFALPGGVEVEDLPESGVVVEGTVIDVRDNDVDLTTSNSENVVVKEVLAPVEHPSRMESAAVSQSSHPPSALSTEKLEGETLITADSSLSAPVVIAQIQVGSSAGASDEYVSIYNSGDAVVDVTGWCLHSKNHAQFVCLSDEDGTEYEMMPYSYISFTTKLRVGDTNITKYILPCGGSSGCIVGTSDTIQLVAADGAVVNEIVWTNGGGSSRYALERKWDTNAARRFLSGNDSDAWEWKAQLLQYGDVEELIECSDGTLVRDAKTCPIISVTCKNMPGVLFSSLPAGSEIDDEGNCYVNMCTNLPGFHHAPPVGFAVGDNNTCVLYLLPLEVTEVLPNPKGVDEGNEFIELYNPNDESVDLTWWLIHLNGDYQKVYSFPVGASIGAGEYAVFKDSDMKFSLRNSSGSVRLRSLDNQYVVDVPEWKNAKDDKSWALIDGVWQYADPSPSLENPVAVISAPSPTGLADCGEGRERNPATGRCRNIPTEKELTPCKEGQYRSEETNRCRSIAGAAASVLKPCADDQFRNPETNRCKKIASAEELADCGEGRERNPETNRCRNVRTASMPLAPFAAEQVTQTAGGTFGWWALGGVTLLAVGYAGWQWRFEMGRLMQKIWTAVSPGPKA